MENRIADPERRFMVEIDTLVKGEVCVTVFDRHGNQKEFIEDRKQWVVYAYCRIDNMEDLVVALNAQHERKQAHD